MGLTKSDGSLAAIVRVFFGSSKRPGTPFCSGRLISCGTGYHAADGIGSSALPDSTSRNKVPREQYHLRSPLQRHRMAWYEVRRNKVPRYSVLQHRLPMLHGIPCRCSGLRYDGILCRRTSLHGIPCRRISLSKISKT